MNVAESTDLQVAALGLDLAEDDHRAACLLYDSFDPVLSEEGSLLDTYSVMGEGNFLDPPPYPLHAWGFTERTRTITLVACRYGGPGRPVDDDDIDKMIMGLRNLAWAEGGGFEGFDAPQEMKDAAASTASLVNEGQVSNIRIEIMLDRYNGDIRKETAFTENNIPFSVRIWIADRFDAQSAQSGHWQDIAIDFSGLGEAPSCIEGNQFCSPLRVLLFAMSGKALADMFERFRGRLLEMNVRQFLQTRTKVNKGIRKTIEERPEEFLALNNGISAVAVDVVVEAGKLMNATGFQIVNGGQTVASIHAAAYGGGMDISRIMVQVKLSIPPIDQVEALVPRITQCANTQNKISESDFSTNIDFFKIMETVFNDDFASLDWEHAYFERYRGQYFTKINGLAAGARQAFQAMFPKGRVFDKIQVARCVNAWTEQPWKACMGAQKGFALFVDSIEDGKIPDETYCLRLLGMLDLVAAAKSIVDGMADAIPAYRQNVVFYLVALLANRTQNLDLAAIPATNDVPAGCKDFFRTHALQVRSHIKEVAGDANMGEVCKKRSTWEQLVTGDWALNDALIESLVVRPDFGDGVVSRQGALQIARFKNIKVDEWRRVLAWSETAELGQKEAEFLSSCWNIARNKKTPSEKQAKWAVTLYERYLPYATSKSEDVNEVEV
jgi:hypothetical protein